LKSFKPNGSGAGLTTWPRLSGVSLAAACDKNFEYKFTLKPADNFAAQPLELGGIRRLGGLFG
jgi:hypothetical protein